MACVKLFLCLNDIEDNDLLTVVDWFPVGNNFRLVLHQTEKPVKKFVHIVCGQITNG